MDSYQIDAAYRPIPSFEEWRELAVDQAAWERAVSMLPPAGSVSRDDLAQAHRIAMRAAAVDTGAIEGLYDVDRGFTMTIALQTATWEAVLDARGEKVRSLIESQMQAYDYVIDLATGREPVSEMWIRALHERITSSQDTYQILTEVGWQNQPLPRGQYKISPNHVRLQAGGFHAYAPVDLVPVEMHRFVEEIRGEAFGHAHPALQAAYAHYALVCIHPFADGNGRVARALASVFTYRSHSVPLLILLEHKAHYLASLRSADAGDSQVFVDFVFERTLDAISLIEQTLKAATAPDPEEEAAGLLEAFRAHGGYSDLQVDKAASALQTAFIQELHRVTQHLEVPDRLAFRVSQMGGSARPSGRQGYRIVPNAAGVALTISFSDPISRTIRRTFMIQCPLDSVANSDVLLVGPDKEVAFTARLRELIPAAATALQIRLGVAARRITGEMLSELRKQREP